VTATGTYAGLKIKAGGAFAAYLVVFAGILRAGRTRPTTRFGARTARPDGQAGSFKAGRRTRRDLTSSMDYLRHEGRRYQHTV